MSHAELSGYITGEEGGGDTQKHVQWQTPVLAVQSVQVLVPEGISWSDQESCSVAADFGTSSVETFDSYCGQTVQPA
jgi:hypothetical protein